MRRQCLEIWQVPDLPRTAPQRMSPRMRIKRLFDERSLPRDSMYRPVSLHHPSCLEKVVRSPFDHRYVVLGAGNKDRGFFLTAGGKNVFRCVESASSPPSKLPIFLNPSALWELVKHPLELPPNTLLYGEIVYEIHQMGKEDSRAARKLQERIWALHVIDVGVISGQDVSKLHLTVRLGMMQRFCEATNKTSSPRLLQLRVKTLHRLQNLREEVRPPSLSVRSIKKGGTKRVFYCDEDPKLKYHIPIQGILLLPHISSPWMMCFSKKHQRKYFYNTLTHSSVYDMPPQALAEFPFTVGNRAAWLWSPGTQIMGNDATHEDGDKYDGDDLIHLEHWNNVFKNPV